ncbi:MAG: DUF4296 domain-containing protein [Paludibacteraceae bacterium]|nr:DUF4296 domain-containing protein [Paludibacteraceae bacterium]
MKINKAHIIFLFLALLFFALQGCINRPRNILSEKKMKALLIDLHKADGVIQESGKIYQGEPWVSAYYESVLDKHGVTQSQFDSTLVWYTDNPNLFDKIYPSVVAALEAEYKFAQEEVKDANARENYRKTIANRIDSILRIPLQPMPKYELYTIKDTLNYDNARFVYSLEQLKNQQ